MKYLIFLLGIIFLVSINMGFFSYLRIYLTLPNLLLMSAIVFPMLSQKDDFIFFAFFCGLFADFFYSIYFGPFAAAFLIAAFFIRFVSEKFVSPLSGIKTYLTLFVAGVFFTHILIYIFQNLIESLGRPLYTVPMRESLFMLMGELLWGIILLPAVWKFLKYLIEINEKFFSKRKVF